MSFRKLNLESLESRVLMTTDLLSSVAPGGATLSSDPQHLVHSRFTYFDARVDGGSRKIFRSNGTAEFTIAIGDGEIEDSVALPSRAYLLSNNSLYAAGKTLELLATLPENRESSDLGQLARIDDSTAIWVQPETQNELGYLGSQVYVLKEDGISRLPLPFSNSRVQLLGVVAGSAWFLDQDFIWSTDGTHVVKHSTSTEFDTFKHSVTFNRSIFLFDAQRVEDKEPTSLEDAGIWKLHTRQSSDPRMLGSDMGTSDQLVTNEGLYYVKHTPETGRELFLLRDGKVDLVADIAPGVASSNPEFLTSYGRKLVFSAAGQLHVVENGVLTTIRKFNASANSGVPRWLTPWNDQIYFVADDGLGDELWSTDGTAEGTQLVADIVQGPRGSSPNWLTPARNKLRFTAHSPSTGVELWELDVNGNARIVRDIRSEPNRLPRAIGELTSFNNEGYFRFNDGIHGVELWRTDGTESGTSMLKDIFPGDRGGSPRNLFVHDGWMYFAANDGTHGYELWRTDGTRSGTTMVFDVWEGSESSVPHAFQVTDDILTFTAHDGSGRDAIWQTTGTPRSTSKVQELNRDAFAHFGAIREDFEVGNMIYVEFDNGSIWASPTDELRPQLLGRSQASPIVHDGYVYFVGTNNQGDPGVFRSQGLMTELVSAGLASIDPLDAPASEQMALFNDELYFVDNALGILKTTAGTTESESTRFPIEANSMLANETHLFAWRRANGLGKLKLYALASDGQFSDLMASLHTSLRPNNLLDAFVDERGLVFSAPNRSGVVEWWTSDGTARGTHKLAGSPASIASSEFARSANQLLFKQARPGEPETVVAVPLFKAGDLNHDEVLDTRDVDLVFSAVRSASSDLRFDLNDNGIVNDRDAQWIIRGAARTEQGDFDLDGKVDFADFLVLSENFGKTGIGYGGGDTNGDDNVDFADFLRLSRVFGFNNDAEAEPFLDTSQ